MRTYISSKSILLIMLLVSMIIPSVSFAALDNNQPPAIVAHKVFNKVTLNNNWKLAYLTGQQAQVVFMTVSPRTNPSNEIGVETQPFDQIIFVVNGNGETVLNGKRVLINTGDMIFIPRGTPHNVINLNKLKPPKLLNVYSNTDIPANAVYNTKSNGE